MDTPRHQTLAVVNRLLPKQASGRHAAAPIELGGVWGAFYWCNALGCTFEDLRAAVHAAGESITDVRAALKRRVHRSTHPL